MKEAEVLHFFERTLDECRTYMEGLRSGWNKNLDKYLVRNDWSKKKEWQFKVNTPVCKPKSKRATSIIKSILLKGDDILDFDTPKRNQNDPVYQRDLVRCNFTKRLLKSHLNSKTCAFADAFAESLEAAFGYCGVMVLKMWVGDAEIRTYDAVRSEIEAVKTLALKSKAIDPYMFDFTPDKSIQIEHQFVTLPEVWDMVDEGVFDEKRAKKLLNNDYSDSKQIRQETEERLRKLGLHEAKNEYRKEVLLSHYWGPIISKDGKFVGRHKKFTVANEAYLLTDIEDNPYFDNSTPYIIASPLKVPFRHVGKSLTEDVNSIEDAICKFVNMQLDNLLWRLLGLREMDSGVLDAKDKREVRQVYPGQVILRRPGSPEMAVKQHDIGYDPTQAIPIIQELRYIHDTEHGVNDTISAMPNPDLTGGQDARAQQNALGIFESVATEIEKNFLVRCFDKGRDLILQYMSDPASDPNAVKIFGEEGMMFDAMPEEERRGMIVSEYNIVARGVSIFFEKLKKINAYTGIYKILGSAPPDALAWLNWEAFWRDVFDVLSLDNKEDKIKTAEQMKQEQEARMAQQQQMMQLEIQKHLLPMQTKLKQTEMGIQERMTNAERQRQHDMQKELMKLRADMEKMVAQSEDRSRDRQSKLMMEGLKIATSE